MRDTFSDLLIKYKIKYPEICVLDGDCSRSTKTVIFKKSFPNDFFNIGIAEQNMVGVAAGLSRCGYRPIVNSFASLLISRACEQIIQSICLPSLPVIIVGHYSGVSASFEGAPHHAISDIGIMSSIPNIHIYTPSTRRDIEIALDCSLQSKLPSYIRLSRNEPTEVIDISSNYFDEFSLYGFKKNNILIITIGNILTECFKILQFDKNLIKHVSFLTLLRISPIKFKKKLFEIFNSFDNIIIIEDHYYSGGLGTLVKTLISDFGIQKRIYHLAISDFTQTGEYSWLLNKIGISHQHLLSIITKVINE